jgi:formiminotetrahydrofolate cyclodeaminase
MSRMSTPSLLSRTVRDFLAAVASESEPVPAGACISALTGASSAALVVLLCRVLQGRRTPPDVSRQVVEAERLQAQLADLIDADAAAYEAFISAQKLDRGPDRDVALAQATRTPLDIAAACIQVAAIARSISSLATGSIQSDVAVAQRLADAAAEAALDTAAQNLDTLDDSPERAALLQEWESLRAALSTSLSSEPRQT